MNDGAVEFGESLSPESLADQSTVTVPFAGNPPESTAFATLTVNGTPDITEPGTTSSKLSIWPDITLIRPVSPFFNGSRISSTDMVQFPGVSCTKPAPEKE